ncbi:MAG: short-chain dehydrogenase [Flavobacteriaceae bacterium TMED179]|nr:MAG: short-chain dehydrogenase [Flavobacteriaceae bacterium TMED179]
MKENKIAIVTGGNRGIGLGITKSFIDEGYKVIVGARKDRKLKDIFGEKVFFVKTDVREEKAHHTLVNIAIKKFGRLDVYINNAGYSFWKPISEINEEFLGDLLDTNLKGTFWGCKAAASVMKSKASIINVSSIAGKRGSSNNSAYVASKFGVNGLTQSLAKELGPRNIRVNAVCPVLIATEGLIEALELEYAPGRGDPNTFISNFTKSNSALLRMPTELEVGQTCLYLASDNASAITGQCINVDCGVLPQ